MVQLIEPYRFKFQFVNSDGQPEGLFRTKGAFDGGELQLGDAAFPAAAIVHSEAREDKLLLAVATSEPKPVALVLKATRGVVERLKRELDVARSRFWAEANRKLLREQGREHTYRERECPGCHATIVLTGFPETPQVYCGFCKALISGAGDEALAEASHRLCDECGLFSAPRKFTIFYFYFLLIVYGFSQRITWRCPACMRGEAWKMFFGNLIFVLGVPVAVAQLVRAYGSSRVGRYTGLDKANILARKGEAMRALELYQQIAARVDPCVGVKFNSGMALIEAGKLDEASAMLEMAMADCANYGPAYGALTHCYTRTGQDHKLLALQKVWGDDEEESE